MSRYPSVEAILFDAWLSAPEHSIAVGIADDDGEVYAHISFEVLIFDEFVTPEVVITQFEAYSDPRVDEGLIIPEEEYASWEIEYQLLEYHEWIKTPCEMCDHLIQYHPEKESGDFGCVMDGCSCVVENLSCDTGE